MPLMREPWPIAKDAGSKVAGFSISWEIARWQGETGLHSERRKVLGSVFGIAPRHNATQMPDPQIELKKLCLLPLPLT